MTRFSAIFCAQLAVSAVVLSMTGAANAQDRAEPAAGITLVSDIGCVDGMPAPPFTQTCPTTTRTSGALAAVPRPRAHAKHKTAVQ
jgi:hypothetical protein